MFMGELRLLITNLMPRSLNTNTNTNIDFNMDKKTLDEFKRTIKLSLILNPIK